MTMELSTDLKFTADYTPSKITIRNEELLDATIKEITDRYSKMIYTDSNIKEAKEDKAILKKHITDIETQRKAVKKEFTKPLDEFEENMKEYSNRIETVYNQINNDVKKYEESEKEKRLVIVQAKINELSGELGIDPAVITIMSPWLRKDVLTAKGELKGKILDEIHDKIKIEALKKQQIESDKQTVIDYAEVAGLDPYAWTSRIDQGYTAADVIQEIKLAAEDKRLRLEEEARQQQANAEYEEAMVQLAQQQAADGTVFDADTGEIISTPEPSAPAQANYSFVQPSVPVIERISFTLKLTGTPAQFEALDAFILAQGMTAVDVS